MSDTPEGNICEVIGNICKAPYIRKNFRSLAHKIHCNTYILKIFIVILKLHSDFRHV